MDGHPPALPAASDDTSGHDGNSIPDFSQDAGLFSPPAGQNLFPVRIMDLHPTQLAVGMQQVGEKRDKVVAKGLMHHPQKLDKFLRKNPLPVVRGPGGLLYMLDHHHLALALHTLGLERAYATLTLDLSHLDDQHFWEEMGRRHYLWPFDEQGRQLDVHSLLATLPRDVTGLKDDPYRSLAALVRKSGGYSKVWVPFTEFQWANFLRSLVPLTGEVQQRDNIEQGLRLAAGAAASHLPGYIASGHVPA